MQFKVTENISKNFKIFIQKCEIYMFATETDDK